MVSSTLPSAAPSAPHIGQLTLRNYRNFEHLVCEFPEAGVAIIGPNGAGKTNLLEAIYYLEVFRSFREARDRDLVRFGEGVFRLEAEVAGSSTVASIAAAYDRQQRIKKVVIDAQEVERVSSGIGALGVAVFRLEDAEIIRGGPTNRRRFLDVTLSVNDPVYLAALQRYRSLLAQRNEALRRGARSEEVEAWTEGLIDAGAQVTASRENWVCEGADRYTAHYERISGGDKAHLDYASSIRSSDPERNSGSDADSGTQVVHWAERFRRALVATAERERRRGVTLVGPHRDEIRFPVDADEGARDLRGYGSSGQQRTAALALRLLEADRLRERLGREPVYLLDDVFAELDEGRSERLLALLESGRDGQVILTAPKPSDVTLRGGDLERWRISNGALIT